MIFTEERQFLITIALNNTMLRNAFLYFGGWSITLLTSTIH